MNREEIARAYFNEINLAIKNLVERCGGTLTLDGTDLPQEILLKNRSLFVHSGITSLISTAIIDHDIRTISLFDWLLAYHVTKDVADRVNQDQFIVALLMALHEQICYAYPDTTDPRFTVFISLYRLAVMTLDGFVDPSEFATIDEFCNPLVERCSDRETEKRKQDARKN